jgi:hypothetical protein
MAPFFDNEQTKKWPAIGEPDSAVHRVFIGGAIRSRTGLTGFAIRGITALLSRRQDQHQRHQSQTPTKKGSRASLFEFGAGNEIRTRDLNLGKVALYQLSYSRISYRLLLHFGKP